LSQVSAAGTHLLIDLFGARSLESLEVVEAALAEAALACGATLLGVHCHQFGGAGGVTGVALLAESHITIHSWPEHGYAAIDIFVCGPCDPYQVLPVLEAAFQPARVELNEQKRGVMPRHP
jgi:S-adenosylmethionine decarboxylase